jgi:formate-dependent nitrite reductase membrane component NrfD
MILLDDAQHFVRDPDWTWYILFYFFFAGLSGGSYAISCLLRLFGKPEDEPAARLGNYVAFVALLPCPVLLTLDLGEPQRFWHMLVNTTPGAEGPIFKYWSPMSVGAWALVIFSGFVTLSFLDAWTRDRDRRFPRLPRGFLGGLWSLAGLVFGLFIAGYTGVLLSVSNQPVWSDTWTLGGLFLASGLSGSAALLGWMVRFRKPAQATAGVFTMSERLFQLLELALIVAFVVTLIPTGALSRTFALPWTVLWVVALIGLARGLATQGAPKVTPSGDGTVAVKAVHAATTASLIVLIGILALRAAIIFSAQ